MKEIFYLSPHETHKKYDLSIIAVIQQHTAIIL